VLQLLLLLYARWRWVALGWLGCEKRWSDKLSQVPLCTAQYSESYNLRVVTYEWVQWLDRRLVDGQVAVGVRRSDSEEGPGVAINSRVC
jgi:hypothetical protein